MLVEYSWYVYFLVEMLAMMIPYYGINFYDYLTKTKSWRYEIQKRRPQGIELEQASIESHTIIHILVRMTIWFFHIHHSTMTNVESISILKFLIQMILYDGISMLFHRYQHSKFGRIFHHGQHHQLRTPTLASSAYLSLGELILSNHIGWIFIGFLPGSFWDHCLFLVISSSMKRFCHSNYDHPWERTKVFRMLKLVGSREHHVHHLHPNKNFADLFYFWDELFGSFQDPKDVEGIYRRENIIN